MSDRKTFLSIRYTYDQVTPESAEVGDYSDSGWYVPGGWHFPVTDETAGELQPISASEALREIRNTCGGIEHVQVCGEHMTVYGSSECIDYRTGTDERIAAHVTGNPRLIAALAQRLTSRS